MSIRISRPQTGYAISDFLRGVQIENDEPDVPRSPQQWQVRHNVTDAGKARATHHARQSNTRQYEPVRQDAASVNAVAGRLQALSYIAQQKAKARR